MERFWRKTAVAGPDECWQWTALKNPAGYGRMHFAGRMQLAHRIAWQLLRGPIPADLFVCHHCDNPACVNPAHLFLGTHNDNMADMEAKGRPRRGGAPKGNRNQAKLTDHDAQVIRLRYAGGGISHEALAREYGVSRTAITLLLKGKHWVTTQ